MLRVRTGEVKALIFDVDGTLYRQNLVRCTILRRLVSMTMRQPAQGLLTVRVLRAYREAQEALRAYPRHDGDLAENQIRLASEWTGVGREVVRSCVIRWMEKEPLHVVARSRRAGLVEFLSTARERGLRLGVFSDYPPNAKLVAMDIAHLFNVKASAQDPEIQQFKPGSRGLEVTCRRLGVKNHETLYVGDRPEIDTAAAWGAGMGCVIIGRRHIFNTSQMIAISGYRELGDAIFS